MLFSSFTLSGAHRALHSFPTRRSSDLVRARPRAAPHSPERVRVGHPGEPRHDRRGVRHGRSEEHTSELQSPDHLVCRLLLEKKKIEIAKSPVVNTRGIHLELGTSARTV